MLNNLVDNAVRYSATKALTTQQAKNVEIHIQQQTNRVLLSVIDFGDGIADEEKKRVFERFYRANYEISGSGVGLAMVKEITDRHQASITISDTYPTGATIGVDFPLYMHQESDL